jgi:hypothetical protein
MHRNDLTNEELSWLLTLANGAAKTRPRLATLARLEGLGLLMRGWGQTYVVTHKGQALLGRQAA